MSDKGTYYLIHEVSELSGLSLSQLRYYERIGLVVPERDEKNKYRKYSPEDIYILASLRNLLRTRLPPRLIKQIAELGISAQAIERVNTAILSLNEQISELHQVRSGLTGLLEAISGISLAAAEPTPMLITYPERWCLQVSDGEVPYEMADDVIIRYIGEHGLDLSLLKLTDCYVVDRKALAHGGALRVKGICLFTPGGPHPSNSTFPAGPYVNIVYRGGAPDAEKHWGKIRDYMETKHLVPVGDLLVFCFVDRYVRKNPADHITILEIPVEQPRQKA